MNHKNEVKVCGRVHQVVNATTPKGQTIVTLVVEVDQGRWTSHAPVQFFDKKAELCKGVRTGDEVEIDADVGGREKDGRWFVNVNGYRLVRTAVAQAASGATHSQVHADDTDTTDVPF